MNEYPTAVVTKKFGAACPGCGHPTPPGKGCQYCKGTILGMYDASRDSGEAGGHIQVSKQNGPEALQG